MRTRHFIIATVTIGIVAVVGCERDRDRDRERTSTVTGEGRTGTTTVTGANIASTAAIDRVVAARCEREAACKNIGTDKRHASLQSCTQKLHADMKDDLNAKECPHGIDQKELNECLDAIKKEECNNPIDTISRLAACRTSDLCLATGTTNK